jgi:hypothetical protein
MYPNIFSIFLRGVFCKETDTMRNAVYDYHFSGTVVYNDVQISITKRESAKS